MRIKNCPHIHYVRKTTTLVIFSKFFTVNYVTTVPTVTIVATGIIVSSVTTIATYMSHVHP